MATTRIHLILIAALVMIQSSPASAQDPSGFFADGAAAFRNGDFADALTHFERAAAAGMRGPAVLYNIGASQYRLGEFANAEQTYRRLAAEFPAMSPLAQYNRGLALLELDRDADARRAFERAQRDSTDEKITALATEAIRRIDGPMSVAPRRNWVSLVDFNVGHDDNILLLDDANAPAGISSSSSYTELLAVVTGPVTTAPGFRFTGSVYSIDYDSASYFNQTAVRLGAVYQRQLDAWLFEIGPYASHSTLDGAGYEQHLGGGLSMKRRMSATTTLGIHYAHDQIDAADARYAFVSGSRDALGVSVERTGPSGKLTFAYELESNDREDAGVSPMRNRLSLAYRYLMSDAWWADTRVSYRDSDYADLSIPRNEDLLEIDAGFARQFAGTWQFNGRYRWSDNDSDRSEFIYSRSRVSLGITKSF